MNKIKPGPVYSIVTPFKEDLSIDFNRLEQYINYAYTGGATQFYVMGYNSRFSELSWDEINEQPFVTKSVKELNSGLIIVADPLHCPSSVSEFTQNAEEYGADMISLILEEISTTTKY